MATWLVVTVRPMWQEYRQTLT